MLCHFAHLLSACIIFGPFAVRLYFTVSRFSPGSCRFSTVVLHVVDRFSLAVTLRRPGVHGKSSAPSISLLSMCDTFIRQIRCIPCFSFFNVLFSRFAISFMTRVSVPHDETNILVETKVRVRVVLDTVSHADSKPFYRRFGRGGLCLCTGRSCAPLMLRYSIPGYSRYARNSYPAGTAVWGPVQGGRYIRGGNLSSSVYIGSPAGIGRSRPGKPAPVDVK
jgi:hypothetical protein